MLIDPERAPLIRQAFDLVAGGRLAGRALRDRLTQLGLRTHRGHALSMTSIYRMLKQPVYAGRIRSAYGEALGDFEPIVPVALFAAAQRQITARGTAIRDAHRHLNHPDFPLRRFVRCQACGKALTGAWSTGKSKRYAFYRCQRGCTALRQEQLHAAFLALLDRMTPTAGMLNVIRATVLDAWAVERATGRREQQRAADQVRTLEAKIDRLDQLFIDGRVDDQTYLPKRDELREAIALGKMTVSGLDLADIDIEGQLAFATTALRQMGSLWTDAATPTDRARVQAVFFPDGLIWSTPAKDFIEPRNVLNVFHLSGVVETKTRVVTPPLPTWNSWTGWLTHMQQLRYAA